MNRDYKIYITLRSSGVGNIEWIMEGELITEKDVEKGIVE